MPIDRNNAQYITGAIYKPTQTSAPGVWDLDDQANNIAKNLWPLPPQAVQRSLRFNSADSAYLNRTLVAGNRKTWTWSCWFKPGITADANYRVFLEAFTGGNDVYCSIVYQSGSVYLNQDNGSGGVMTVYTVPVYRDPSAWYHLVVAVDTTNSTSANTVRIYINGVQQSVAGSYPATNLDTWVNGAYSHRIGARWSGPNSSSNFDGYMAEVNFVDGYPAGYTQATFATNNISALFGETDPQTGVWIPKRYTGTYGTNGFRLSFANNSSTTALGYDSSGQGNNWTANNFSVTPGAGNDSLLDVPSLYGTDTGLGGEVLGNYCTWNPLYTNTTGVATLSNGNLDFSCPNTFTGTGTMAVTTGKWYWEITPTTNALLIGIKQAGITDRYGNTIYYGGASITGGGIYVNGSPGANFSNWTVGDVIGVAPDMDAGLVYFYKNGVLQGSVTLSSASITTAVPAVGAGAALTFAGSANFGQRPFAHPAPSGYRALCTTNLPAPAIGQTAANQADNHFNVVTWTGNGSNRTITGVGFQPDLIWIKNRSQGAASTQYAHNLYDTVRGINAGGSPILQTNLTDAEITYSGYGVSAVNADGFSLIGNGSLSNFTGDNYVAWCWNAGSNTATNSAGTNSATIASTYRANRAAGFSIVAYTGTGAAGTIAHGLGVAPIMIIVKSRTSSVRQWPIYHSANRGTTGSINPQSSYIYLNLTNTAPSSGYSGFWNDTAPTSNVFSVGTDGGTNASTENFIAYCFAAIPGFSAFGSYTGNGSSDGPFVHLGFRPAFLMFKNISQTYGWQIFDAKRNPNNRVNLGLYPNISNAEGTEAGTGPIDFLSNGFKIRDATWEEINGSTRTYIYAAFAETPARLSTAR